MNTIKDYFREFEKAEIVKSFFGEYPDLHDSEVIELRLNRELGFDFTGPKLYLTLYTFNSDVADTDPTGRLCLGRQDAVNGEWESGLSRPNMGTDNIQPVRHGQGCL